MKNQGKRLLTENRLLSPVILLSCPWCHQCLYWAQLLGLDPTSAIAYARKGFALNELNSYEEALAMLDQALTLDPNDDGWVHMLKGFALNELNRYEEALPVLDRALTLDPTNVQAKGLRNTVLQKFKQQR